MPAHLLFRPAAIHLESDNRSCQLEGATRREVFGTPCEKSSKVRLASLRAASHPDKGDRGAGLGQSGAPRTHSATELP